MEISQLKQPFPEKKIDDDDLGVSGEYDIASINQAYPIMMAIRDSFETKIPMSAEHLERVADALFEINNFQRWTKGQMSTERRDAARQAERYLKKAIDIIEKNDLVGHPNEDGFRIPDRAYNELKENGGILWTIEQIAKTKLKAKAGSEEVPQFVAIRWGKYFVNQWNINEEERAYEKITAHLLGNKLTLQEFDRIQRLNKKMISQERRGRIDAMLKNHAIHS